MAHFQTLPKALSNSAKPLFKQHRLLSSLTSLKGPIQVPFSLLKTSSFPPAVQHQNSTKTAVFIREMSGKCQENVRELLAIKW